MGWRVLEPAAHNREPQDIALRFRPSHALLQGRIPASHMNQERFTGEVQDVTEYQTESAGGVPADSRGARLSAAPSCLQGGE